MRRPPIVRYHCAWSVVRTKKDPGGLPGWLIGWIVRLVFHSTHGFMIAPDTLDPLLLFFDFADALET